MPNKKMHFYIVNSYIMVGYSYSLLKIPAKIDQSISANYHLREPKHLENMAVGEEKEEKKTRIQDPAVANCNTKHLEMVLDYD